MTLFICHAGYEVTAAEDAAAAVPGVRHTHARARWTGRTLRIEIEGWVDDAALPVATADELGHKVIEVVPEARAVTVTPPRHA